MTNVAIRNNHYYKFELKWIDCGLTSLSTSEVISWWSVLLAEETGVPLEEDIILTFIQVINGKDIRFEFYATFNRNVILCESALTAEET